MTTTDYPIRRTIPTRVHAWSLLAAVTFGAAVAHLAATGVLS